MVEIELRIHKNNTLRFPNFMLDHIGAKIGDILVMKDDVGKHGRFISFWKK